MEDLKEEDASGVRRGARTALDIQRSKLEKLMKNPDKPVHIPQPKNERDPNKAPEFVYNVMGSSAGAGSGEFHVYRQIRRKEMLRQGVLSSRKEADDLNDAYHQKLAENERLSAERTNKKRNKRMKKKEAKKKKKTESEKNESDVNAKEAAKEESEEDSSDS